MSHAKTRLFKFCCESEIYFELTMLLSCSQGRIFNSNLITETCLVKFSQGNQIPTNALPITKNKYKEYCEKTVAQQGPLCRLMSYTEFCATLIQRWWRFILLRPVFPRPPPPTTDGGLSPTGGVQQRASTADSEEPARKKVVDREEAARIIQRSWRKHIVSKIINFLILINSCSDDHYFQG